MHSVSLTRHLVEEQRTGCINAGLRQLLAVVARACTSISIAVSKGALGRRTRRWREPILGIAPAQLQQRMPVFLGSNNEVVAAERSPAAAGPA